MIAETDERGGGRVVMPNRSTSSAGEKEGGAGTGGATGGGITTGARATATATDVGPQRAGAAPLLPRELDPFPTLPTEEVLTFKSSSLEDGAASKYLEGRV